MRSIFTAFIATIATIACGFEPLKPTVDFSTSNVGGNKPPVPSKQLYVDLTHASNGSGTSEQPFATIQSAINAATADTEIRISAGQYNEVINLKSGVSLRGGYTSSNWSINDPIKYVTIIVDPSGQGGPNLDQPKSTITISASQKPLMISNLTVQAPSVDADSTGSATYNESSSGIFAKGSTQIFIDNVKIIGGSTGKYTSGIMLLNANAEVTQSNINGGNGLNSYGLYMSGTSVLFANKNKFEASGLSYSMGLFSSSTQISQIRGNHFSAGQGGVNCYGILNYAPSAGVTLIANNVVTEAGCSTRNIGFELRGDNTRKGQLHVRNNTISPSSSGNLSFAAPISLTTLSDALVELTNNMLVDYGENLDSACIYENDANSAPHLIRNNNLHGCNHLYRRFDITAIYLDTITIIQNETAFDASNNKASDPHLDPTLKFTGTPNTELTHGGIDGKLEDWTFADDRDGHTRTDDKNAIGWTIGAYEFD